MAQDVAKDQLAIIKIQGMHCHKCEQSIQKALGEQPGVHEAEVDFNSGQASVLFDGSAVTVAQLMQTIDEVGYQATGFTQRMDP